MGMLRKLKRRLGLSRRYGHFGLKDVDTATADLRKIARDNPAVTAAAIGAGVGAIGASMGVGTAALLGAAGAVAVEQVTGKK